jgi:hypothetical protein
MLFASYFFGLRHLLGEVASLLFTSCLEGEFPEVRQKVSNITHLGDAPSTRRLLPWWG